MFAVCERRAGGRSKCTRGQRRRRRRRRRKAAPRVPVLLSALPSSRHLLPQATHDGRRPHKRARDRQGGAYYCRSVIALLAAPPPLARLPPRPKSHGPAAPWHAVLRRPVRMGPARDVVVGGGLRRTQLARATTRAATAATASLPPPPSRAPRAPRHPRLRTLAPDRSPAARFERGRLLFTRGSARRFCVARPQAGASPLGQARRHPPPKIAHGRRLPCEVWWA